MPTFAPVESSVVGAAVEVAGGRRLAKGVGVGEEGGWEEVLVVVEVEEPSRGKFCELQRPM